MRSQRNDGGGGVKEPRCRECKTRAARTNDFLCLPCKFPEDQKYKFLAEIRCFRCSSVVEQGMGRLKGICDDCFDKIMAVKA
jgi:hypothetical protein